MIHSQTTYNLILTYILVGFISLVSSQQYVGQVINNTLPTLPGSIITYFNVQDPKGKNDVPLTLINYMSLNSTNQRVDGPKVKRGVIVIHGLGRDPGTYMSNMFSALSQVPDSDVNFDSVAMCAPYFPNSDDKNVGYPWTNGLAPGKGSTTSALVWQDSGWADGQNNQYPWNKTDVSSFAVVDQLVQYFDNKTIFPNMEQIVIAGHSLGGQAVQRYAAVGNVLSTKSPVSYYTANPNSYVWFNTDRPIEAEVEACPAYDVWRDGFTNYTAENTYGDSLVAEGRSAVLALYNSRTVAYARGLLDLGDDSANCAPFTTGQNRNERFFEFIQAFPVNCTVGGACSTIDFVNVGHDAEGMFASTSGQARLFLDNFNGTGVRAYDMGYPRIQAGDDPYPNPALATATGAAPPLKTWAGGMTYQGCWTDDQDPDSLSIKLSSAPNNTVGHCTSACVKAGYVIAGMEYGDECWCSQGIAAAASKIVEAGCSMPCSGNSSEICGDSSRLSLYSSGPPKQLVAPSSPASVITGNLTYDFQGCWTEANTERALSNSSFAGATIDVETCAEYCLGYTYFGLEYADQCYCGDVLNAGSVGAALTDCNMVCAANVTELCGAGDRLSLYLLSNAAVSSISSSSTTSLASTASSSYTSSSSTSSASRKSSKSIKSSVSKTSSSFTTVSTSIASSSSTTSSASKKSSKSSKSSISRISISSIAPSTSVASSSSITSSNSRRSSKSAKPSTSATPSGSTTPSTSIVSSSSTTSSDSSVSSTSITSSASLVSSSSTSSLTSITFSSSSTLSISVASWSSTTSSISKKGSKSIRSATSTTSLSSTTPSASLVPSNSTASLNSITFSSFITSSTSLASLISTASSTSKKVSKSTKSPASETSSGTATSSASVVPTTSTTSSTFMPSLSSTTSSSSTSRKSSKSTTSSVSKTSSHSTKPSTSTITSTSTTLTTSSISTMASIPATLTTSSISTVSSNSNTSTTPVAISSSTASSILTTSSSPTIPSSTAFSTSIISSTSSTSSTFVASLTSTTSSDSVALSISTPSSTSVAPLSSTASSISRKFSKSITRSASKTSSRFIKSSNSTVTSSSTTPVPSTTSASPSNSNTFSTSVASLSSTTSSILMTSLSSTIFNSIASSTSIISSSSTALSASIASSSSTFSSTSTTSSISVALSSSATSSTSIDSSSSTTSSVVVSSTDSTLTTSATLPAGTTSPTDLTCPASNGTIYTADTGSQWLVQCYIDHNAGDLIMQYTTSLEACIDLCAITTDCLAYSWVPPSPGPCYMKYSAGYPNVNSNIWGGMLLAVDPSSTLGSPTTSASPSTTSTSTFTSTDFASTTSSLPSSTITETVTETIIDGLTDFITTTTTSAEVIVIVDEATTLVSISTSSTTSLALIPTPTLASTTSISTIPNPVVLPSGVSTLGCYMDTGDTRVLPTQAYSNSTNTPSECALTCRTLGYEYSGTEYGKECWCGDALPTTTAPLSDCSMPCPGDLAQLCGASFRLSVTVDNQWVSTIFARQTYGTWNLVSCYEDLVDGRTFPNSISATECSGNMTVANCLDGCAKAGYTYCAPEYAHECYGSNTPPPSAYLVSTSADPLVAGCDMPCAGNATEACGGAGKLLVYINNGTSL